jgi:hypothetical protein
MVRDVNGYVACVTGTPVQVTTNLSDAPLRIAAQSVLFQAHPDNTGVVYVGLAGMDPATGVGVLGIIPAPADPTTGPFPSFTTAQPVLPASLNVADFYVEGTTGDSVLVSYAAG